VVVKSVLVKDTYWNTQTSSIWSYTSPKTILLGNRLYDISFKYKKAK